MISGVQIKNGLRKTFKFAVATAGMTKPSVTTTPKLAKSIMDKAINKQYTSINQIISEAERAGSHFFSKATLRFFSSRIHTEIYGGCYFITSERDNYRDSNPRFYTIRKYEGGLRIETIGEFCQYTSKAQAVSAVKKLIKTEEVTK